MRRVVRPGGRIAFADVHGLAWPLPRWANDRLVGALRPFNTWHAERDVAAIARAQGLAPVDVAPAAACSR